MKSDILTPEQFADEIKLAWNEAEDLAWVKKMYSKLYSEFLKEQNLNQNYFSKLKDQKKDPPDLYYKGTKLVFDEPQPDPTPHTHIKIPTATLEPPTPFPFEEFINRAQAAQNAVDNILDDYLLPTPNKLLKQAAHLLKLYLSSDLSLTEVRDWLFSYSKLP